MDRIFQVIRAEVARRPQAAAREIARIVLRAVTTRDWRAFVLPLLIEEVEHAQRRGVRNVEQDAVRRVATPSWRPTNSKRAELPPGAVEVIDKLAWLENLWDQTFALGDKTRVSWGKATIEQHMARVAFFDKQIAGDTRARGLHQLAVDTLREAGKRRLIDLKATTA